MKSDPKDPTWPTLYKRASSGKIQEWTISLRAEDDGSATIVVVHGLLLGKKQEATDNISKGKNAGRKNATTPYEQAYAEAEAKWTAQQERGNYGLNVQESDMKLAKAPMLAQKYQDHRDKIDWSEAFGQPKLDGNRGNAVRQGKNIFLWTREGVAVTVLPELADDLLHLMPDEAKWDGEFYIHGVPLAKINSLLRRRQPDSAKIAFHLYDVVAPLRYSERVALLRKSITKDQGLVHVVETNRLRSEEELMKFQAECIEDEYEGAMLRHGSKPYETGKRSDSLLKVKTFQDGEFKIIGCHAGRGSHSDMAVFECETVTGSRFDVTAPGTHDEKRNCLKRKKDYIGKYMTVKYQCYTSTEEPVPFQPIAKNIID